MERGLPAGSCLEDSDGSGSVGGYDRIREREVKPEETGEEYGETRQRTPRHYGEHHAPA